MPGISPRSSIERKPPCCRRYSRILLAVAGPTPSRVSSCSAVAVLRLTGAGGGPPGSPAPAPPHRRGTSRAAARHDDLLAVGDLRRQVDRVDVRPRARAARAPHGVLDALAVAQPVDARAAHRPGHMDERDRGLPRLEANGPGADADAGAEPDAGADAAGAGPPIRAPGPA